MQHFGNQHRTKRFIKTHRKTSTLNFGDMWHGTKQHAVCSGLTWKFGVLTVFLLSCSFSLIAQQNYDDYVMKIKRAHSSLIIDGKIDEESWKQAEPVRNFYQHYPLDSIAGRSQMEVRATYDDRYLYFSFVCLEPQKAEYLMQSLRRDFDPANTDGILVIIDPLGTKNTGFGFGISPAGVQREGAISFGGLMGLDQSWDNIWITEVSKLPNGWSAEVAIPFNTLRFENNRKQWRINFARWNWSVNELVTWTRFPQNFRATSLAHTGILEWDESPAGSGVNLSVVPSVVGSITRDYTKNNPTTFNHNLGTDIKYGVTSSLNLDITINPDFSNVNADRQITNLERFSIFFPEQRQFFIENSDVFSSFGFSSIRPFFSRKIGLLGGSLISIPVGARLSGNVNQDLRIGLMTIQTARTDTTNGKTIIVEPQNYTVAAAQYRVLDRSNFGVIFANRQGNNFGHKPSDHPEYNENNFSQNDGNNFNRTLGFDFNYGSSDGLWNGKIFYHHNFTPQSKPGQFATATWLSYGTPGFNFNWNHEYIGENYNPEIGFVRRTGVFRLQPNVEFRLFPQDRSVVNMYGFGSEFDMYMRSTAIDRIFHSEDGSYNPPQDRSTLLDRSTFAWFFMEFSNTSNFNIWGGQIFTKLMDPWDVTGLDETPLPAGDYNFWRIGAEYSSDKRNAFTLSAGVNGGAYFVGNSTRLYTNVNYRFQPFGSINVSVQQDYLTLPLEYQGKPLRSANFTLIATQLDITPTRNIFFTTFVQYNTQASNVNVNSRLQWRFAPMSDVFLVYTDNYGITPLQEQFMPTISIKNRGLALKLTYWLNV